MDQQERLITATVYAAKYLRDCVQKLEHVEDQLCDLDMTLHPETDWREMRTQLYLSILHTYLVKDVPVDQAIDNALYTSCKAVSALRRAYDTSYEDNHENEVLICGQYERVNTESI
jgi:hypothetical protein